MVDKLLLLKFDVSICKLSCCIFVYETFSGLFVNVVVIVKSLVVWIGSAVPRLINFCVEPLLSFESFRKRTRMAGSSLKSICRKFRHVYEGIDVDDLRNP